MHDGLRKAMVLDGAENLTEDGGSVGPTRDLWAAVETS